VWVQALPLPEQEQVRQLLVPLVAR